MNKNTFLKDVLAGLTVSFAALSLGAAFGTMSGRGALAGMIGAAIIPIITSLFGGTRIQASGPTAPMTAVTAVMVAHAYESFADKVMAEQFITLIILLSGILIAVMGIVRLGKLITYIPHAVVLGFMNGIAVLIWFDQSKKLLGLGGSQPIPGHLGQNIWLTLITVVLIFAIPSILKRVKIKEEYRPFFSAILIAIFLITLKTHLLDLNVGKVSLGKVSGSMSDYFASLKNYFPSAEMFGFDYIMKALPFVLQLSLLAYLDSLLTAVIIDKMNKETTKKNKELMAQGAANFVSGLLQGIPGAQATIRSVLLLKEHAQTRLAGVFIGVFVLIFLVGLKDLITLVPQAVFAGILIKVGWDVAERQFISQYFNRKWFGNRRRNFQLFIMLITTFLTIVFNLNVAVISGTIIFYVFNYFGKQYDLNDIESNLDEITE